MKKVTLVVHRNYVEKAIEALHKKGLMQIIDISKEDPDFLKDTEKSGMHPEAETCAMYELRLTRLIDILKKITPKKKGIKAMLSPELPEIKDVSPLNREELYSLAEGFLGKIEKTILEKESELQSCTELKEESKENIEKIEYLSSFKFDFSDLKESKYLVVKVGITKDLEFIKDNIKKIPSATYYSKQFGTKKKAEWAVLIVGHKAYQDEIDKISKASLTEFSFDFSSGAPKQVIKRLKDEIKEIDGERKKIIKDLRNYAKKQLADLLSLREQIKLERIRKEVSTKFAKTDSSYIIKGWILEENEQAFEDFISSATGQHMVVNLEKPSVNPDNPPTYIKTPRWANGFKGLVSMFSLPRYNEINPTIIMGIFFVLFFGIMLGDAGYGSVILALSLFGYFKLGKHSEMFRDWSFMGIWLGLVTTIVGILTYSIFGDLVPRFFYNGPENPIYSFKILGIQFPVESLKDPISILVMALIFGLIHLNVGVFLGIVQSIKNKQYKEMLTTKLCWIPLQIAGVILIGSSILDFQFSGTVMTIGYILAAIGFIQLLVSSGPIGFFDITGYVGDWLSYARLLALGLATAGMALAFNVVAQLLGDMIPVIGIAIMIIILIFAHMINLGLQALGAGIHSLRLQYVEFFNRFYQGGGHEFSPFKIKRKYTKMEEEK